MSFNGASIYWQGQGDRERVGGPHSRLHSLSDTSRKTGNTRSQCSTITFIPSKARRYGAPGTALQMSRVSHDGASSSVSISTKPCNPNVSLWTCQPRTIDAATPESRAPALAQSFGSSAARSACHRSRQAFSYSGMSSFLTSLSSHPRPAHLSSYLSSEEEWDAPTSSHGS